jgi:hypothetical protein
MPRSEHRSVGTIKCVRCGRFAWEHRTRTGRKQIRLDQGHAARTRARELTTFIGVDGEGVTRADGTHDYVLLTVGTHSLRHTEPTGRLTWKEIFPFLYNCFEEDPHAAFVGYYLGYDFTQWLRTLNFSRGKMLFSKEGRMKRARNRSGNNHMPFPVHVGTEDDPYQWEIDILGMKRFKIRPGAGTDANPSIKNRNTWMYICDAGAFFQQSFLKTLKEFSESNPEIVSKEEYETIRIGKERRATAQLDKEMERYNLLECELLGRIMPLLNDGFKNIEINGLKSPIVLRRDKWFGPGQAAQAWMKNIKAPTTVDFIEKVPEFARNTGWLTYFGGWFEIFLHGLVPGTTYEYDINSAYPEQIAELPCLNCGSWDQGKTDHWDEVLRIGKTKRLMAVHALVQGSDPIGAMLHRNHLGRVLRPSQTLGWYWLHELQAAIRAGVVQRIRPDSWIAYEKDACRESCTPLPFHAMRDLYTERLKVGKKTPRGKTYKLVYNSTYGKTAQSQGHPTYANGIYASLITCGCRTKILDAIATHPKKTADVVMVATDGIYFRSPHPSLPLDDNALGLWSMKEKKNLTLFMPGLYWDDTAREALRQDKHVALKSRGVPAKNMARKILEADELFATLIDGPVKNWPTVPLALDFSMTTPGQAVDRGKWLTCGTISTKEIRTITANPVTKRCNGRKAHGIVTSDPYMVAPGGLFSEPYDRRFGDEREAQELSEAGMTPEGDTMQLASEELRE